MGLKSERRRELQRTAREEGAKARATMDKLNAEWTKSEAAHRILMEGYAEAAENQRRFDEAKAEEARRAALDAHRQAVGRVRSFFAPLPGQNAPGSGEAH